MKFKDINEKHNSLITKSNGKPINLIEYAKRGDWWYMRRHDRKPLGFRKTIYTSHTSPGALLDVVQSSLPNHIHTINYQESD